MSMIFDSFKSINDAKRFASEVRDMYSVNTTIHSSQVDSNRYDPLPFLLHPPIVLVHRSSIETPENSFSDEKEEEIQRMAKVFGAKYAGT